MSYKPYHLVVRYVTTMEYESIYASWSPTDARSAEKRVSRNPKAIDRIELRDAGGKRTLETIWSRHWT